MTHDLDEVVKVYAGSFADAEAYQSALTEAGIECKRVGDALLASFGSAIPQSIELWVHQRDFERAIAVIKKYEAERGHPAKEHHHHSHPTDSAKPGQAPMRKEPHVKQDPSGQ